MTERSLAFLAENGYKLDSASRKTPPAEYIDPTADVYDGTALPEKCAALLAESIPAYKPNVRVIHFDNTEYKLQETFFVEFACNPQAAVFVDSSSSPFCTSLDQAFEEATLQAIYRAASRAKPKTCYVGLNYRNR